MQFSIPKIRLNFIFENFAFFVVLFALEILKIILKNYYYNNIGNSQVDSIFCNFHMQLSGSKGIKKHIL